MGWFPNLLSALCVLYFKFDTWAATFDLENRTGSLTRKIVSSSALSDKR